VSQWLWNDISAVREVAHGKPDCSRGLSRTREFVAPSAVVTRAPEGAEVTLPPPLGQSYYGRVNS
jgi:hypothetical protein